MALTSNFNTYVTTSGDTFDLLAILAYDDEKKASYIVQANPQYMGTLIFDAGIILKIPVLDATESSDTLPPWRR